MPEPKSTTDLRILDEMAEEIEKHGHTQLPGSLRSHIKTKRGDRVAFVLETLARKVSGLRADLARKTVEINGLRSDMQALSDSMLEARR